MEETLDIDSRVNEENEDKITGKPEEDINTIVKAPDGGWGWVIVFASFMCNVIVDGIIFSYGLFIPELAEYFGETKGRLTWVGSLLAGFYLIAGPVVSGFANAYGCRPVTIIGALISATSFAISCLAPNMSFLCITFGVIGGIGFGFIYLPAVVTVGFYFERRRAFATGLAVCGSGVGAFVITPLVKVLLRQYNWKGTMLILAGVILQCVIFGTLFRPIEPKIQKKSESSKPEKPQQPLLQRIKKYRDAEKETWESQECLGITSIPPAIFTSSSPEVSETNHKTDKSYSKPCQNSSSHNNNNDSPPPSYSEIVAEDERLSFLCVNQNHIVKSLPNIVSKKANCFVKSKKKIQVSSSSNYLRPFYRQDILYSASVLHLPEFRSQPDLESYYKSITKIPHFGEEEEDDKMCSVCCSPVIRETFRQMLDMSLLRSPTFLIFATGGFLTLAGFFIPFMFIIDRAITSGISLDNATFILQVIGITNTVGRIFSGWVSDHPKLNALVINNLALIIGGLATIFSTYANTLPMLIIYGTIFGFSIACFATLRSIIIVELLGLERLTNAFGLLLLFQGIASILGSPIAGKFYDITGSYDASFYISGTLILVSGLISFPLPYVSQWEKRRNEKKSKLMEEIKVVIEEVDSLHESKVEYV